MANIHIIVCSSSSSTKSNMFRILAGKCFGRWFFFSFWSHFSSFFSFFLCCSFTYFLCLLALLFLELQFRCRPTQPYRNSHFQRTCLYRCSVLIYSCTYYYHHHLRNLCTERWFVSMFKPKECIVVGDRRREQHNFYIFVEWSFASKPHISLCSIISQGDESMKFVHLFLWNTQIFSHFYWMVKYQAISSWESLNNK